MNERIILVEGIDPLALFGVNNTRFNLITNYFPKLKIIARGDEIKVIGPDEEILLFENKVNLIIDFYRRFNSLSDENIIDLLNDTDTSI
ncbi:MAG: phosphate starvation-inducible protein PhoH, partial [Rikenellaceae bacterium]|nr:phosphate starvation-inducible protein PhoH [Rikenellaceae bacterium]